MKQMKLSKWLRSEECTIHPDDVCKHKDGTISLYKGYFYKHGQNAHDWANAMVSKLQAAGFNVQVHDYADQWRPFRGGASVKASSHFRVTVQDVLRTEEA